MVSADNLGSLLLGGFKESCTAIRMCRFCMATKEDTQKKVCLSTFIKLLYILYCIFSSMRSSSN